MYHDYEFEQVRLASFIKWPYQKTISPYILANNGFYYLQYGNAVKCFSCCTEFSEWCSITSLFKLHKIHPVHCAFRMRKDERNVWFASDPLISRTILAYDEVDS